MIHEIIRSSVLTRATGLVLDLASEVFVKQSQHPHLNTGKGENAHLPHTDRYLVINSAISLDENVYSSLSLWKMMTAMSEEQRAESS